MQTLSFLIRIITEEIRVKEIYVFAIIKSAIKLALNS